MRLLGLEMAPIKYDSIEFLVSTDLVKRLTDKISLKNILNSLNKPEDIDDTYNKLKSLADYACINIPNIDCS